MSFNDVEISNNSGNRIGLYYFRWGAREWFYTSSDQPITYGVDLNGDPAVYVPEAISDSGVLMGGELGSDFTISLPRQNPVALLYRVTPPAGRLYVKVRRKHLQDAEAPLYWSGTITNVKPQDGAAAKMSCRASVSGLKRTGLRLTWQRQCPHDLYGRQCGVPIADWSFPYTISSVVGNVVTVTGGTTQDVGFYSGGIIRWDTDGNGTMDYRMIEAHTAARVFTLFGRGDGLEAAMEVLLSPGCTRDISPTGCERFDNVDNYGGHLYMPGKSPFDGEQVF